MPATTTARRQVASLHRLCQTLEYHRASSAAQIDFAILVDPVCHFDRAATNDVFHVRRDIQTVSARGRVAAYIALGLAGVIYAAQPIATSSLCKEGTPADNGLKSLTNHDENPTEKRGRRAHIISDQHPRPYRDQREISFAFTTKTRSSLGGY